ncbi:MAG: hypothetical protein ACLPKB_08005 [Xanthobacteraceae bacterium]
MSRSRTAGRPGAKRRTQIGGQFTWRLIEMLEAPAYRVLSLSAHRVLARIEIELAHHGGMDNGHLVVTYENFEQYGIDRHAIAPAIREAEALGFIQVTEPGRAGTAWWRRPNRFRLTYKPTKDAGPTDKWRLIKTLEEAEAIARAARRTQPREKAPVGENTSDGEESPHRPAEIHAGKTPTTEPGGEILTTFYILGGGGGGSTKIKQEKAAESPKAVKPSTERTEFVQQRIAERLGNGDVARGWVIFGELTESEIDQVTEQERSGGLDDSAIDMIRAGAGAPSSSECSQTAAQPHPTRPSEGGSS